MSENKFTILPAKSLYVQTGLPRVKLQCNFRQHSHSATKLDMWVNLFVLVEDKDKDILINYWPF